MTYEEELSLFIKRTERERNSISDKMEKLRPCSDEAGRLNHELRLLNRRHIKELFELNAKYHMPPPEVVDNSKKPF
ncbi:hypothetical protein [Dialister sp.]|uniref:hypothetical protein n=1 Tax=Dialister sp. TaxID=1955814 RepID=UPI003F000EFB